MHSRPAELIDRIYLKDQEGPAWVTPTSSASVSPQICSPAFPLCCTLRSVWLYSALLHLLVDKQRAAHLWLALNH